MVSFMKAYQEQTYALLRITTGFMFLFHGSQKLLGFPPASFDPPSHILYVAAPIELIGGALIMVGLFTAPWPDGGRLLDGAFQCRELFADHEQRRRCSHVLLYFSLYLNQRQRHLERGWRKKLTRK